MNAEQWVFVGGFTQTERAWDAVRVDDGAPRSVLRAPVAASFVAAAAKLGAATAPGAREARVQQSAYAGYSQGGRLCLQLTLDRPDMVQGLVLVSAAPGIADESARAARREADEQLAQEIERLGVERFLDRWLAQPLFATLPPERAGLDDRRAGNTVDGLTYQLRVLGQGAQPSNWERLGEIAVPVLLVVGELDTKYVGIARDMASLIPDARLEVIPRAGHACHLEAPDRVAHLLRSWSEGL